MDIEKLKYEAQNKALHIADVSGSALFNADCMDILPLIPDKSVQLILADLPYGTTANKWDSVLPLNELWVEYNRILKNGGVVLLTCTQPFTTILMNSNFKNYHCEWIWHKSKPSGIAFKNQPMRNHESILVFNKPKIFNPIMEDREGFTEKTKKRFDDAKRLGVQTFGTHRNMGNSTTGMPETEKKIRTMKRKPTTIRKVGSVPHRFGSNHPTEKPVELMKYLITTYSNENDMVLDNTMGSGTTCLAAKQLNRKFIGIEKEPKYYEIACQRCGF